MYRNNVLKYFFSKAIAHSLDEHKRLAVAKQAQEVWLQSSSSCLWPLSSSFLTSASRSSWRITSGTSVLGNREVRIENHLKRAGVTYFQCDSPTDMHAWIAIIRTLIPSQEVSLTLGIGTATRYDTKYRY